MVTELSRLPHLTVYQLDEEDTQESPINVTWYTNGVELEQEGRTVLVDHSHVRKLFRAIEKNTPAAMKMLEKL